MLERTVLSEPTDAMFERTISSDRIDSHECAEEPEYATLTKPVIWECAMSDEPKQVSVP